jgi:GDPmannose 4,6-dehydratase
VIATGLQFSVRQFVEWTAAELGLSLEFSGSGLDEIATVINVTGESAPGIRPGQVVVRVDPRYFRPAEVETLLGDPSKARDKLGWQPEVSAREMCREMVSHDVAEAKQAALLRKFGYASRRSAE